MSKLQLSSSEPEKEGVWLSSREAAVFLKRFTTLHGEPATLSQVGSDLGLSREAARQLSASALSKLAGAANQ